jgi:hypothetical protein
MAEQLGLGTSLRSSGEFGILGKSLRIGSAFGRGKAGFGQLLIARLAPLFLFVAVVQ